MLLIALALAESLAAPDAECPPARPVGYAPADGSGNVPVDTIIAVQVRAECGNGTLSFVLENVGSGEVSRADLVSEGSGLYFLPDLTLDANTQYRLRAPTSGSDLKSLFWTGESGTEALSGQPSLDILGAESFDGLVTLNVEVTVVAERGFEAFELMNDGIPVADGIGSQQLIVRLAGAPGDEICLSVVQHRPDGSSFPESELVCEVVPDPITVAKGCSTSASALGLGWLGASLMLARRRR